MNFSQNLLNSNFNFVIITKTDLNETEFANLTVSLDSDSDSDSELNRVLRRLIMNDKISYKVINKLNNNKLSSITFVRFFLKIYTVLQYLFSANFI